MRKMMKIEDAFEKLTGHKSFPYQKKPAESGEGPLIRCIPTGTGKTAAVVLGRLWHRRFAGRKIHGKNR
jgi:CRISPR/Cas system-associated endonuclease/helicase Cas3